MSIQSAPHFWVVCDLCGDRPEDGDFNSWLSVAGAVKAADEECWHIEGGNHLCLECFESLPDREDRQ